MSILRSLSFMAGSIVLAVAVTGCTSEEEPPTTPPAVVEDVPGSEAKSVTLRADAAEAVGIRTAAVARGDATGRLTIPYAAVVYYLDGSTWAYTETGSHTFQRAPITVASITGDVATLTAGPPVGTPVVVVGAPEVFGAELEIDGEQ
ncbi:hypothetical protein ASE25_13315 [Terrabacter sp. Root85]|jgi:hypothetical protein|uniref:hypothetical protein n=1 Tax=unclassified Terrabacter TaxID=2630222 RepID=UPI0006FA8E4B|nr:MULTISPECIES: hypothetical protein [unclassified Terrabacter]KRC88800.1 hypothetical protein ASE25_13315 [Terrabacter sp. Root85]KRF45722.1 hypothetical protein ASH01_07930 [Terrabacter sp. Soil811]